MVGGRTLEIGVRREGILRLGHADREFAISSRFPGFQLIAHRLVGDHIISAIDFPRDGFHLVEQAELITIDRLELRAALGQRHHMVGERFRALRAFGPVRALEGFHAMLLAEGLDGIDFGFRVCDEVIDGNGNRHAELLHVFEMAAQVGTALLQGFDIFLLEIILGHTAMHLERADGGNDHRSRRVKTRLAALDIKEFFSAEISAEACFRDNEIHQFQRGLGRHHRIAAMGDVGEGSAMHEGRVVFQRLHQVWHQCILEQYHHGTRRFQILGQNRRLVLLVANHDLSDAALQVCDGGRQAQDRHDFRGHSNIKARLARITIGNATQ